MAGQFLIDYSHLEGGNGWKFRYKIGESAGVHTTDASMLSESFLDFSDREDIFPTRRGMYIYVCFSL